MVVLQDGSVVVEHGRLRPAEVPPASVFPGQGVISLTSQKDAHLVWMWKLLVVPVCSKSWMAAANKVAKISNSLNQC